MKLAIFRAKCYYLIARRQSQELESYVSARVGE